MDNETLRYFYMYSMFRANCNHYFFAGLVESWIEVSLNMNFNLYSTSCIGISLLVRISEGYIIKLLMNLYNALEACIVGCYLEGLEK